MLATDLNNQPTPEVENDEQDESLLNSLRVKHWDSFQGQQKVKESLQIAIQAARHRQEAIDHVLLYGPPGLGKTTLSHIIAKEMNAQLTVSSGTALAKSADLAAILTNLQHQDVLFIDEIHRLPKPVEEMLYTAMEDFALDIVIGKGPSARTVRLDLAPFTLVGATTKFGSLSGPFRDRFGVIHRMEYYQPPDLIQIITQAAGTLSVSISDKSSLLLAERARGTPRIALKLLKRVRDFAQVNANGDITDLLVEQALALLSVDARGLNQTDRTYLESIIAKYNGGPAGLSTIAATLNEDPNTIEEVIEPYLLQLGFIQKTPQGRVITKHAYSHLQLPFSE